MHVRQIKTISVEKMWTWLKVTTLEGTQSKNVMRIIDVIYAVVLWGCFAESLVQVIGMM